ncbi:PUA-like domain-containing protein [Coniochaeta sp. 2T2.1]|nr:PUA-like domain-containing protein [Coniochaeta sp. 2T2.1]
MATGRCLTAMSDTSHTMADADPGSNGQAPNLMPADEEFVPVITLPQGYTVTRYLKEAVRKIGGCAHQYKKHNGNPPETAEVKGYLEFLEAFLPWLELEGDAIMTPTILSQTNIRNALNVMSNPAYKCPEDIAARAKRIFDRFEEEEWGADREDKSGSEAATPISPTQPARITDYTYTLTRPPPPEHPIWGLKGIMHGFLNQPTASRKVNYVFDPRYAHEKRNCKVFGHNGLTPGDWWPYLKVALFHGAHGMSMAGISGSATEGTWSIVVSGSSKYKELDQDLGDTIWYSSDQSHENEDPLIIPSRSNMTKSLHTSYKNGKPVRVLRSSGKSYFAPTYGVRYDGLYTVVDVDTKKNAKGGLFEQFKLERRADQDPLKGICLSSPTPQQLADFDRVKEGY